ncbi:hypothetical protein IT072_06780 [Leifsonia sp. ZF2019]|uniref:hypothetical protein n=1 Tax=Leifsonia sp. ZF2019 TaxID=2781978 RepID=UPI001CC0229B|nr:hypothetical protein [Leifsonia sp. ZF2019]UAJ80711.1 hypothetical protein IT072_06780 [Leifsonia sp. ZF2019]
MVAAVTLTGCSSETARGRLELHEIPAVSAQLHCDESQVLKADMAFHDDMRGFNCFYSDKQTVLLRAYEHSASLDQILPDLAATISAENQIVIGKNWYATGSPAKLRELARNVNASPPESILTARASPPLSPQHEALGMCGAYVTSAIYTYVFEPAQLSSITQGSDDAYPGIQDIVQSVGAGLKAEDVSEDTFDSRVTDHANTVREFCARIYGQTRESGVDE